MKSDPSNMVCYVAFIKHSPIGDNNIKIPKNSFWKKVQKSLLCPYFDSLIPAVFYAVKISIFQDSCGCNFFFWFDTIAFRGAFRTTLNIYDIASCKISQHFLAVNYFCKKILDVWRGPECASEYICSNVLKWLY